jgi:hypothetical protein
VLSNLHLALGLSIRIWDDRAPEDMNNGFMEVSLMTGTFHWKLRGVPTERLKIRENCLLRRYL